MTATIENGLQPDADGVIASRDVAAAAGTVMQSCERIARDRQRGDGKYRYASADAIYDAVRGALGEAGLPVMITVRQWDEREVPVKHGPPRVWATARYDIGFYDGPVSTVVQGGWIMGPQGYGALMTYALKMWLRSTLLLSTGEPDADATVPGEPPPARQARRPEPKPRPRPSAQRNPAAKAPEPITPQQDRILKAMLSGGKLQPELEARAREALDRPETARDYARALIKDCLEDLDDALEAETQASLKRALTWLRGQLQTEHVSALDSDIREAARDGMSELIGMTLLDRAIQMGFPA